MSATSWSAVVVNHDAGPLLAACVSSLLADTSTGAPPEVVVVDNDSHDDSLARLRRDHPGVRVLHAPGNVGYARAANLGIAATRSPIVAVLNPDTVVGSGTAGALVGRLRGEPDLGAVGPRLRNPDGSQYPSARRVPTVADAVGHGIVGLVRPRNRWTTRYRQLDADPDVPRDVDWVSGAAIWLDRRALDDVGGWDERYFMYVEDVDLCWRLGRAGWRVAYEPRGSVVHVQGSSTARRPYRMIVEHHVSLWRFARRRWRGPRRILLPAVAGYLGLRAGLACADHARRRRRSTG